MTHSVTWDDRAALAHFELLITNMLREIGPNAVTRARQLTPRQSGYAANSLFFVIRDANGRVVGGDSADANGVPAPTTFPGSLNGWIELVVAANADYFIWIEIGTSTRPARNVLAQTLSLITNELRSALTVNNIASAVSRGPGAGASIS